MKRLLVALLGLALSSLAAQARWEIQQKGTGAAVWKSGDGVEYPTGPGMLLVELTSLATPGTTYVVTHKPGKVKKIYAVASGTFATGATAPALTFHVSAGTTSLFKPISRGLGASLSMVTTYAGAVGSVTPSDIDINVVQGGVIAIYSNGSGANPGTNTLLRGFITIIIE